MEYSLRIYPSSFIAQDHSFQLMDVFDVEPETFEGRESFNSYLSEEYESLSDRDLYIITGISEQPRELIDETLDREGWEILQDYGAIQKIGKNLDSGLQAEAYFHYDAESQLLLFYTDQRKTEEIEGGIEPLLNHTTGLHYLYISPRVLKDVREGIVEQEDGAILSEFVAKRTERTETHAVHRPDNSRTFNYYGDDGLETLREIERDYGVLPHIMQIEIPGDLTFRVNKEGVFKLKNGSLSLLFHYMEDCIQESLRIKEAYNETHFQMLEVSENIHMPGSTPATIQLQNHLEYHEIDDIEESLESSDYVLLDSYAEEGSLFFSGKVYDEESDIFFNIRANQDEIRVFPAEESEIGTFFRFYEFVQDKLDDRANFATVEG